MNNLLNLTHLKFFCDAATYQSVSEAAKMNYVTQSTVSQAILKLERILGASLIVHSRQKFQLTEQGKIVYEQARHIFKTVLETYDKLNRTKEIVTGKVTFVSTKSLGMSFMAALYKKMRMEYPEVELNFRLGGLNYIRNALRQGEAELGIVVYDNDFKQFSKHPLRKGSFNLYQNVKAPHHLIEHGIFVDYLEGMYISDLKDYFQRSNRHDIKFQAELSGWETVARFTDLGIGVGFFPDYILSDNRYPNLHIHPIEIPKFQYEICAIYNKGEKLSQAASAFIDLFAKG